MAVLERRRPGAVPLWEHPEWRERFPWLVQGTTGAGEVDVPFDLGLFGTQPVGAVLARSRLLREALEMPTVLHARQIHGGEPRWHETAPEAGLTVQEGYDGHATRAMGLLLSVSVADCVPVFVVDPERRAVALVHAGWRGVAADIVEQAIRLLTGAEAEDARGAARLWLHCGPAICGRCYPVGLEVHAQVHPRRPVPATGTPIDLRAAIADRASACGLAAGRVSTSAHCTRCGPGAFFSHRGGSAARQMGVLGVRP